MSHKTKIAIAIAIFLWASAFVGIRAGLSGYSPGGLALFRYLIASMCIGIIYYRYQRRKGRAQIDHDAVVFPESFSTLNLRDVCAMFLVGAFGIGVYNLTLNYGELRVSSGIASFIVSQSPIITTILATIFLGEQLGFLRFIGFIISMIGIACITIGEAGGLKWDISIFYILLATIAGGSYSILHKPFLKKYHAIEATTYVIWGGTLFLLLYLPELKQDLLSAPLNSTLMVIYLGVFPAAIAYIAWSYVLSEIPASQAVNFLYFIPFLATILGWLYLNEVPMPLSLVGGLLAIIGVWLVNQSYNRSASR